MDAPKLIEPNFKNYIQTTLQSCHETRVKLYYIALNAAVLSVFVALVSATLYYCYTKKPNHHDKRRNMIKDQELVLTKIRHYQTQLADKPETYSPITNLPSLKSSIS
jgi:hypothetical protein